VVLQPGPSHCRAGGDVGDEEGLLRLQLTASEVGVAAVAAPAHAAVYRTLSTCYIGRASRSRNSRRCDRGSVVGAAPTLPRHTLTISPPPGPVAILLLYFHRVPRGPRVPTRERARGKGQPSGRSAGCSACRKRCRCRWLFSSQQVCRRRAGAGGQCRPGAVR